MNTKRKIVYGIARNDYAGSIKKNGKHIKSYRCWISMLSRCYGKTELEHRPSYQGCSVCDEWLSFSNFKEWFDENYIDGYQLDKDILVKGNRVYSPDTCCFVPQEINTLILEPSKRKQGSIKGVYVTKYNTFIAGHSDGKGNRIYLGTYKTLQDAKNAYSAHKESLVKQIARDYFDKGKITQKVYDALVKYKAY